jgi:hypothetical protein
MECGIWYWRNKSNTTVDWNQGQVVGGERLTALAFRLRSTHQHLHP